MLNFGEKMEKSVLALKKVTVEWEKGKKYKNLPCNMVTINYKISLWLDLESLETLGTPISSGKVSIIHIFKKILQASNTLSND